MANVLNSSLNLHEQAAKLTWLITHRYLTFGYPGNRSDDPFVIGISPFPLTAATAWA